MPTILALLAQEAEGNDPKHLYPHWEELLIGVLAFAILFYFVWKWVLPRVNTLLEERREKIQGELEKAEATRQEADAELARYRGQLANAREESNRIIEEARQTAEQLRVDLQARAEEESRATVARAQEEIRAERDRVFQELRGAGRRDRRRSGWARGGCLARSRGARAADRRLHRPGRSRWCRQRERGGLT